MRPDTSSQESQLRLVEKIDATARKMVQLLRDLISADRMDSVEPKRALCDVGALALHLIDDSGIRGRHPVETRVQSVQISVDGAGRAHHREPAQEHH